MTFQTLMMVTPSQIKKTTINIFRDILSFAWRYAIFCFRLCFKRNKTVEKDKSNFVLWKSQTNPKVI